MKPHLTGIAAVPKRRRWLKVLAAGLILAAISCNDSSRGTVIGDSDGAREDGDVAGDGDSESIQSSKTVVLNEINCHNPDTFTSPV